MNNLNKGIVLRNSNEKSKEMILDINNKYYHSQLKLSLINLNQKDYHKQIASDIEGLIVFWSSRNLGNINVNLSNIFILENFPIT